MLADGMIVPVRAMSHNAAGPDLRRFIVGWEGRVGIITGVVLGEPAIELLPRLDKALDPNGLVNPGTLLSDR